MKVFVSGAGGYIGSYVVDTLIKTGHDVTGLARSEESAQKLRHKGIAVHKGDLQSPQTLVKPASEADAVIHTAMPLGPDRSEIDTAATRAMLDALKGTGKTFIYTSGTWIYGSTGDRVADEDTPVNPLPLTAWRVGVEQDVIAASADKIRGIVIRPAMVYSGDGGILAGMVDTAKSKGFVTYVGDGGNIWTLVHVDDLARLYVLALESAPAGSILIGSSGEALAVREIAELLSHRAGVPGQIRSCPVEEARKELGQFADALTVRQRVKAVKTVALLNWKPQAPSLASKNWQ